MMSNLEIQSNLLRLYQIANANLEFHASELTFLYNYSIERGVNEEELKRILHAPPSTLLVPEKIDTKVEYLYDLTKMALADGNIDNDEKTLLRKFAISFGFELSDIDELLSELESSAKQNKTISEILNQD
jgi:hypothetical protein